jgi:hypothetical protein
LATGSSGIPQIRSLPGRRFSLWFRFELCSVPYLSIQVIDKNSDKVVETVEPRSLDKTMWTRSGIDPRPWKQKFYEGNKEYYFVITTKHIKSYVIEARIPKSA